MTKLVRLYILCVLTGFGISALFLGFLLWQDVMGLRHLVLTQPKGWLAGVMLFAFNGSLFAGVQFGVTIMGMAEDDGPKGGLGERLRRADPAVVRAAKPKR